MDVRPSISPRLLAQAPGMTAAPPPGLVVTGVTLDSRSVRPGDLYAALPGEHTHGARFAAEAVRAGAAAVLTDPTGAGLIGPDPGAPVIVERDPRARLGRLSSWIYGDPAHDMIMVGVTGTNGKTTMTFMIAGALAACGHTPGRVGTIGVDVDGSAIPSPRTTPEAPDLHALLAVMREAGVTAVAMEVSSHALALGRVDGVVFDVAVFTNLTQDHLDFHGDMEAYFAAKASLFEPARTKQGVICTDDPWGRRLRSATTVPTLTYGVDSSADWRLRNIATGPSGAWSAVACGPDGADQGLSSPLPGRFNMANALGSLVTAVAVGGDPTAAATGIADCPGVPGRLEPVAGAAFGAFVDYAHTPDAVGRVIAAAREFCRGRLLVALGCGGDRDAGKRPQMGRVASEGADLLVVTDDNPRSEDPAMIRRAVMQGARHGHAEVIEIGDRRGAIRALVERAGPGDVVLVLGKGHEQGQEAQGVVTPFDDRDVLRDEIMAAGAAS